MTSRNVATPTPLETMSLVNDYLGVFEVYKLLLDIDVLSVNVTGDPHQTKKMAALPWPVDSVTETAAREFFDNAPDPLFPGSWRIENSYSPRICDVKANGKVFAVRFKMYSSVNRSPGNKFTGRKPKPIRCRAHSTREEAEQWCYRDIYARVHRHANKFRTPAALQQTVSAQERNQRAAKRAPPQHDADAAAATKHLAVEANVQRAGSEMKEQYRRRATLRSSTTAPREQTEAPSNSSGGTPERTHSSASEGHPPARLPLMMLNKIKKAEEEIQKADEQLQLLASVVSQIRERGHDGESSAPADPMAENNADVDAHCYVRSSPDATIQMPTVSRP